ncbi:DUF551 domain-containing protein [Paraburkholderia graminis]|uniref:DUF551 domain-containing protein n=1 Tax=Paraburkholderia graminis TaxID=60548 RepID=UPI0038BE1507
MVEDLIKRLSNASIIPTVDECLKAAGLIEQQAARLTALESERDALLAAAGKEAVKAAPVGFMMKHKTGMDIGFAWKANDHQFSQDWIRIPLYTAPTAALEKGDGRDAEAVARHALAATDSDRIALIRALQKALAFWMPKVFDERSAHDAYLLIGYEGDDDQRCWGDEMVSAVSRWTPVSEQLPAKPGWYLAMLAPDNDWGLMSDTPLQVEFDAYISKPKAFTCLYDYRGDEDISAAVTHWQPLPAAPAALSLSLRAQHEDACIEANKNAKDAERYRWLRTLDSDFGNRNRMSEMARFYGETLDESIDAAMSQNAGENNET